MVGTMMNLEARMLTSYFQTNFNSVYSIIMVASEFDVIVENAHCSREFDILILSYIVILVTWSDAMGVLLDIYISITPCSH